MEVKIKQQMCGGSTISTSDLFSGSNSFSFHRYREQHALYHWKHKRLSPVQCNKTKINPWKDIIINPHALPFFLSFFFFSPPPADDGSPPIIADMSGIPGICGIPGIPCRFCISAIASLRGLSLTPPPLYAGECMGRILPIFQPLGAWGAAGSFSGVGRPLILKR